MPEMIKTPEQGEQAVDENVLSEVVEKMLVEKNEGEILTKAFFWRAIYLYCEAKGIKMDEIQARDFYCNVTPVLIKIFKEKRRSFKGVNYAGEEVKQAKPAGWYAAAEERLEELNEGKRLGN